MTKLFKIGEYAIGGIIKVQTTVHNVKISALDWNTEEVIMTSDFIKLDKWEISEFLHDLTSSYHAEKIMEFINKN